ncbi:hypothetical protein SK128_022610 [Halocaridina rubra]|uniref:Proteasome assembly chaperone 1 n=1 Tax=Halocaridina rubra TaxID=373956 RepID=A0AAN9A598_HALRR
MALDFGELRYSSSRAYDELEDEDTENTRSVEYRVTINIAHPEGETGLSKCDRLILSYGTLAIDFCETLLLSEQCVNCGSIIVEEEAPANSDLTGDFRPRKPKPSTLYIWQNSVLMCTVSDDVVSAVANTFSSKLLGLVNSECNVMILSSHHYGQLQGCYSPAVDGNCSIHSLCSPAFIYKPAYIPLPQPATIDSVPAAVLSECIVESIPCVLYPIFTETYSTGDLDLVAESLLKVFTREPFKNIVSSLDQNKLHKYRSRNPRKEMLDRYM